MKILVCVDLSESSAKVIAKVEEMAKKMSAELWLLCVEEPEPDFVGYDVEPQPVRDFLENKAKEEHAHIEKVAEQMRLKGLKVKAVYVQGGTVAVILAEASKLNVDMIAVGSHGHGALYRVLIGSTSEEVLHQSEYPVLVIPTHK